MSTIDAEIEQVHSYFAALSRGDIDSALAGGDEATVIDVRNSHAPWSGVYRGPEEGRAAFGQLIEAWEELRWETSEVRPAAGKRIVCASRLRGRGRGSGVEVDANGAWLLTIRRSEEHTSELQSRQYLVCRLLLEK